jgi:hypothetical protein
VMGKDRMPGYFDTPAQNGVKRQANRQMSTEMFDMSSKVWKFACHTCVIISCLQTCIIYITRAKGTGIICTTVTGIELMTMNKYSSVYGLEFTMQLYFFNFHI